MGVTGCANARVCGWEWVDVDGSVFFIHSGVSVSVLLIFIHSFIHSLYFIKTEVKSYKQTIQSVELKRLFPETI